VYVWREAEKTLGRSLEIQLDAARLLAAAERIYSWETGTNRALDRRHD
jgi:hypothetical protein